MLDQKYPEKQHYKHWKLVCNGGKDLETQLTEWYKEHPNYAVTHHQFMYVGGESGNGIAALTLTFFDLDEMEKDIPQELRTPINRFYFKEFHTPFESDMDSAINDWTEENNIDIISKNSYIDIVSMSIVTGIVYVDRAEAEEAFEKKKANQQKQIQAMANKMAGIDKEQKEESDKK